LRREPHDSLDAPCWGPHSALVQGQAPHRSISTEVERDSRVDHLEEEFGLRVGIDLERGLTRRLDLELTLLPRHREDEVWRDLIAADVRLQGFGGKRQRFSSPNSIGPSSRILMAFWSRPR